MSDAKQKRILLIGIGRWGANHLRILKSMPIELFVADHHEQRLRSAGVAEAHRSTDPRSFFTKIDAAVIVTPAQTHFDMCRELLEMGKDVFVEKPITLVSTDAKKLAEQAEKSGLILQVGHIFGSILRPCGCGTQSQRGDSADSKCCARDLAASNVRDTTPASLSPTAFILLISSTSFSEYCRGVSTP